MNGKNQKLIASLSKITGSSFGSMVTESAVKLAGGKKNPMQGRITKRSEGGSIQFFGTSKGYRNMKQRQLAKQGINEPVEVKKRPWGERINQTPLVTHKGNLYVECIYRTAPKVTYFLDGKEIEKNSIDGIGKSRKQEIALRVLKLETIKKLKMGKESVE